MGEPVTGDEPVIDDEGRPEPPLSAGEAETLLGFLNFQRATFEWKVRGLDDAQLRARLHPTSMTLAGLLKHLALVEDLWFTGTVAGGPLPAAWASVQWDEHPDWAFTSALEDAGEDLRALWNERVGASRAVVGRLLRDQGASALDRDFAVETGERVSLRWVLTHMVEEYARHNGHADLMREAIDGGTGE